MANGVKSGTKYPASVRELCLGMSYASQRAYEILRSTFKKNLPDRSTLRAWYANSSFDCAPGINSQVFQLLEKKVAEKKAFDEELICSLSLDEMSIRRHAQWCHSKKMLLGYPSYGKDYTERNSKLAKQTIVFMISGVNDRFHFPIAYHFITSINGIERAKLLKEICDALNKVGVNILNVTFDGYSANFKMCETLGANLKFDSNEFQPYIIFQNDHKTYIFNDPPHNEKLVRNTLAKKKCLIDKDGGEIKWSIIEKLVEYSRHNNFNFLHKLKQKHIQWKNNIMNVEVAVQTFSNSTADSIQILMNENVAGFENALPTIQFIRNFNDTFDVLNSKTDNNSNIFKKALCPTNRLQVFELFDKMIEYIKHLKFIDENNEVQLIIESDVNRGFNGFITNMLVIKLIYQEYVENKQLLTSIQVYWLGQDILEILFGKIRASDGYNDNPTVQQFMAAFRKLLVFYTILCSKHANCKDFGLSTIPFANILYTSSRASISTRRNDKNNLIVTSAEIETLYQKIAEIEALENNSLLDNLQGYSISYVATLIEQRIINEDRMYCDGCKNVFEENDKIEKTFIGSKLLIKPTCSTFEVCREVDRFIKFQLMRGNISHDLILAGIWNRLQLENLFPKTNFNHDSGHKLYLVRSIIDVYIQIKSCYVARKLTEDVQKELLRSKFRKIIQFQGL